MNNLGFLSLLMVDQTTQLRNTNWTQTANVHLVPSGIFHGRQIFRSAIPGSAQF